MSLTLAQIFALNPAVTINDTDLFYLVQSPYTPGTDAGITGATLKSLLGGTGTITSLSAGTGITLTPNPITTTGSISLTSVLTSKGDIYTFTTVNARLPVGTTNGQILQVNSITATGLAWSTAAYPVTAGTSGNVLTSDGTNFLSSAPSAASTTVITNDTTTNATMFPTWVTANTGSLPLKVSSTKLSFNPATATLTLAGAINGLTGTISQPTAITSSTGLNVIGFGYTANAVNNIEIINSITNVGPLIQSNGSDSAVPMRLGAKNSDFWLLDGTTTIAPTLRFYNAPQSHYTGLKVATAQGTDVTFTLPAVDGILNQPLVTDGAGHLSFGTSLGGLTGSISQPTGITSSTGLNLLGFGYAPSAVNYAIISNSATGTPVTLGVNGTDPSVDLQILTHNGNLRLLDGTNTIGSSLKFYNALGTHFTGLKVATAQVTDVTFTLPAVDGVANTVIKTNGSGTLSFSSTPVSTAPVRTVLTSGSGNYTTAANVLWLEVELVGGGAGGGSSGTALQAAGTAGNNTTFSTLTASGGAAGAAYFSGGIGGAASGGDFNITGGGGGGGSQIGTAVGGQAAGGKGGNSYFGGAGISGTIGKVAGGNGATNSGGGGGGGGTDNTSQAASGGGGGAGGFVKKIISPTAGQVFAYAVGAAANGATAGTNGAAGGNGAAGIIIVTAHYQ